MCFSRSFLSACFHQDQNIRRTQAHLPSVSLRCTYTPGFLSSSGWPSQLLSPCTSFYSHCNATPRQRSSFLSSLSCTVSCLGMTGSAKPRCSWHALHPKSTRTFRPPLLQHNPPAAQNSEQHPLVQHQCVRIYTRVGPKDLVMYSSSIYSRVYAGYSTGRSRKTAGERACMLFPPTDEKPWSAFGVLQARM